MASEIKGLSSVFFYNIEKLAHCILISYTSLLEKKY